MGEDKPSGIVILTILYVLGALGYLGAGALFVAGGGFLSGIGGGVLAAIGAFFIILGLIALLVAYGLWTMKSWARMIAIIIAVLMLFNFPIGTILGIIILWYLFKPEIKEAFH
ncbi:MAG: hypothetical protein DRN21_03130 [Thermoplasmata archaeon]|nr:MAG: hypothetical protein DRN21_03130 [Thermoplasmata archaeon]RLF57571.1 MAG: hypothetical protein DRN37_06235 [Thermoplasmata archaeon]